MKPIIAFLFAVSAFAQVPIGTGSGSGGGGSSSASSIRSGLLAAIPATCAVADVYYATDATIATGLSKLYVCTATDTWTQQGIQDDGSGSMTFSSSASGSILAGVTAGIFAPISAGYNYASTMTGTCTNMNGGFLGSTPLVNSLEPQGSGFNSELMSGSTTTSVRACGLNWDSIAGAGNTVSTLTWDTFVPIAATTLTVHVFGISVGVFATGNMSMAISYACVASGATTYSFSSETTVNVAVTNSAADQERRFVTSGITLSGCSQYDHMVIRVRSATAINAGFIPTMVARILQ